MNTKINARLNANMSTKLFIVFTLMSCCAPTLWAADTISRLNIKEGLWEVTTTHSMTGMPGIPADKLAKMTPDQRAQVEAMMKNSGMGGPTTDVTKDCVTKEKLDKLTVFSSHNDNNECSRSVLSSSGSKMDVKIHCQGKDHVTDGTFVLEVVNSDSVKGSMHTVTDSKGRTMNMDFTYSSKYLGAACGDVK
jgi:Protein of unknown function (DUF3617)